MLHHYLLLVFLLCDAMLVIASYNHCNAKSFAHVAVSFAESHCDVIEYGAISKLTKMVMGGDMG